MKSKFILNFPQKSIFGFKILSSFQSSIASYLLLLFGKILNPFFGLSKMQLLAGFLFNLVLNISVLILIINLSIKRKQIKKLNFLLLNLLLFIYLPIGMNAIIKNTYLFAIFYESTASFLADL